MKIYSVSDPAFKPYGKVLTGFDTAALIAAMKTVPMPESGTAYEPSIPALRKAASLMRCRIEPTAACPSRSGCAGATTQS